VQLLNYLTAHALQVASSLPPGPGKATFEATCARCHVLPDPRRHTANEWPVVVERMRRNMAWANRVTGDPVSRTSPELDTAGIIRFLHRNSRNN
jgi:hypothetical protein